MVGGRGAGSARKVQASQVWGPEFRLLAPADQRARCGGRCLCPQCWDEGTAADSLALSASSSSVRVTVPKIKRNVTVEAQYQPPVFTHTHTHVPRYTPHMCACKPKHKTQHTQTCTHTRFVCIHYGSWEFSYEN